jgi:hypothetical protein
MRNRFGAVAVSLVVASGCSATEPTSATPPGAVPITAPPAYAEWFAQTESCSGLRGPSSQIQWYVVPGVETFETDAGPKVGMWVKEGEQEVIVIAGNYQNHEMVVRHEMLHSLLRGHGHPTDYFVERCHLTWESWPDS